MPSIFMRLQDEFRKCRLGSTYSGIVERLCPVEQSDPCVVDSDAAYDHETKQCVPWPPKYIQ